MTDVEKFLNECERSEKHGECECCWNAKILLKMVLRLRNNSISSGTSIDHELNKIAKGESDGKE